MAAASSSAGARADVAKRLAATLQATEEAALDAACSDLIDNMLDEISLGICFELHRSVKTGVYLLTELPSERDSGGKGGQAAAATDVFGQVITTSVGVPTLKKQPECVCPNCQRNLAASRFAPHLEKCMGMGRNSSRIASRRIASSSSAAASSSATSGAADAGDGDDAEDEDWHEPRAYAAAGDKSGSGGNGRRKRDKNSPRRQRGKGSKATSSGDTTPQDGCVTPPSNYDQLTLEERSHYLSTICGVVSSTSRKICSRSTRCPVHTDAQRREVRIRWLSPPMGSGAACLDEEGHVDIDSFTEGDTAALRESLAQLSRSSSPAESVISTTSSNLGGANTRSSSSGGRRDKGRRGGKKGRPGSKGGSRGSTPPLMHID